MILRGHTDKLIRTVQPHIFKGLLFRRTNVKASDRKEEEGEEEDLLDLLLALCR